MFKCYVSGPWKLAVVHRWLPLTVTIIDRFHCSCYLPLFGVDSDVVLIVPLCLHCVAILLRYEEDESSPGVCDHLNAGLYSYTILSRSFVMPKPVQQPVGE